MPLPTSRRKIKQLGERLACDDEPTEEDLRLLEELTACHLVALEQARPRVDTLAEDLGIGSLHITHRPKTTKTIIEKLRRHVSSMPLHTMQDLAGIRIVGAFSLDDQDRLAIEISSRFPPDPRPPRIRDRRAEPSFGYRAVHVIVSLDDVNIEVQVRTMVQHIWANLMERIADRLGRQIRYGDPPTPPMGMTQEQAETVVAAMMAMSERWVTHPPDMPEDIALYVEPLTDMVWTDLRTAISAASGVDL